MIRLFFTGLLLLFTMAAAAQDVNAVLKEADRLESIPNELSAFHKFKEALKIQPVNLYALIRCSELCSRIGNRQADKAVMNDYFRGASIYAESALRINAASSEANCVMAIAMGRIALTKSGKEKISAAKQIKHYAELALRYDPANFKAWHVIGKWHYEVSNLNVIERAAARVFFGGIPSASLKESIEAYQKALVLSPGFVANYLELAKACKRNHEKSRAISLINTMLALPNKTEDDEKAKLEGRELLKKLL